MSNGLDRSFSDKTQGDVRSPNEVHYQAIVESQAEMICRFRPDGTILFVNSAYARARGTTAEALATANLWEFVNEADRPSVRIQLAQLSPTTPEIRIENRFETAYGVRWTLWTNRGLAFDADGNAIEVQSTGIDITERKLAEEQLRASQERQRIATEAAGLGVFEWNAPNDYAVWENERIYEIFGHQQADAPFDRRQFFDRYLHPEDIAEFNQAIDTAIQEKSALHYVGRIRRKSDKEVRWISIDGNFAFTGNGDPLRLVGVVADITDQKHAEEALRHINETLEDRIAERTVQVRALAAQLTVAQQEERRRIAQILHDDLQQHIFGAQFQLQALRNALHAGDSEQLFNRIDDIDQTLKTSIGVTRRLSMDLSPPILSASGLTEIINWLAAQMQQQHGLTVHVRAVNEVRLPDQDLRILLLQVVRELLFNVVKHAKVSEVFVTLVRVEDWIRVEVRDHGNGFSADETGNKSVGSHGLWQTTQRLELIGGRVQIESKLGHGTTVTVDCPLRHETA
ncbi:PAS domain S-box protein [bacterium]|nr:PAS domain S-box protein [bacterium]